MCDFFLSFIIIPIPLYLLLQLTFFGIAISDTYNVWYCLTLTISLSFYLNKMKLWLWLHKIEFAGRYLKKISFNSYLKINNTLLNLIVNVFDGCIPIFHILSSQIAYLQVLIKSWNFGWMLLINVFILAIEWLEANESQYYKSFLDNLWLINYHDHFLKWNDLMSDSFSSLLITKIAFCS